MGYVRLDGSFYEHPITEELADKCPGAIGFYVRAACYAERYGLAAVKEEALSMLTPGWTSYVAALESAGAAKFEDGSLFLSNYHRPRRRATIGQRVRRLVFERDGRNCGLCGKPIPEEETFHLDHIVPWSLGGSDAPHNLQVTHASCNIRKGASV